MEALREAESLVPGHPAVSHVRGQAFAGIWKWADSAFQLAAAAEASPADDALWARLAIAYGSAGEAQWALDAAAHGLQLNPRDADMLRVQALALDRVGALQREVAEARDAYGQWRPPDDAPAVKNACAKRFAWCALERLPVHVHPMR
jgi:predicted Zn-dependent protease